MPEGWIVTTLRRRLRPYDGIKIGPFGSQLKLEGMVATGYKVYGQANVIAEDFGLGNKHIDVSKFLELQSCEVRPGDLLITMMGTSGRCARVPQGAEAGIMDSHLLRLRPDDDLDPDFLALVLDRAVYVKDQVRIAGKGSIMEGLNSSLVKDLVLALPSMPEQAAIVRFLGHADRRMRRYIAAKKRLITLLNEQKQAIVHRAVTRGLDPSVALTPSGVEWLGDIPCGWGIEKIKALARPGYKTFVDGDWIESPYITDKGIRLVQTGNVGVGRYKEKGFRFISEATFTALGCTEFSPNDVLICRLGDPVGRSCLAPELGSRMITSVDVCILKTRHDVAPAFVVAAMSSRRYLEWVGSLVRGSTRDRVSRSMLGSFQMPVPPYDEQIAIVRHLEAATSELDLAIGAATNEIVLLREYRTRLIADVVTGKLDVVDAAAQLPNDEEAPHLVDGVNTLAEVIEADDDADLDDANEVDG